MTSVRVKLNRKGVRDLLRGPEAQADLARRADRVAASAGEGYEAEPPHVGKNRARATVRTATPEAASTEPTTHRLIAAIDAGRDTSS